MTDEQEKQDVDETPAEEPKPKRRRTRAKAKPQAAAENAPAAETKDEAEAAPAEKKPARSRARAKKEEAPEEAPIAEEAPAETDEEEAAEAEEEKPAKPAPARKRAAVETPTAPPVVRAQAKYVRSSARKARLVCEHIRGKGVDEARAILRFTPRAVARDWSKLLESAVANAEHNHELVGDDLRVSEAYADEGPTLKRYRPRAMGRATRIRKRTSHLTIKLTPK
jgi:ribosomal protein L22